MHLVGGARGSASAACAVAPIVAAFGFVMLQRRLPSSGRHSHGGSTAERHFPFTAVVAHGMSAGATVLLVVLGGAAPGVRRVRRRRLSG